MNDVDFEDLVAREIRNEATIDEREWLRSEDTVQRWATALGDLVNSLNHQYLGLAEDDALDRALIDAGTLTHRALTQRRAERATKRRKMGRFKRGVETRLSEAKGIIRERNIRMTASEDHEMRYLYREAIKAHRAAAEAADLEPEEHDLELWSILNILPGQVKHAYQ